MTNVSKANKTSRIIKSSRSSKVVNSKLNSSGMNTTSFRVQKTPAPAVDGAQLVFTLPDSEQYVSGLLEVYVDGLMQTKDTDYSETTSSTFTMAWVIPADSVLRINYIKQ
jgi:hypothetical protein